MRTWWARLPRRGHVVLPLRFVALTGLGLCLPSAVLCVTQAIDWARRFDWRPTGAEGYLGSARRAAGVWLEPAYLGTLWYYTSVVGFTFACGMLLLRGGVFWTVLRRFPR